MQQQNKEILAFFDEIYYVEELPKAIALKQLELQKAKYSLECLKQRALEIRMHVETSIHNAPKESGLTNDDKRRVGIYNLISTDEAYLSLQDQIKEAEQLVVTQSIMVDYLQNYLKVALKTSKSCFENIGNIKRENND